MKQPYNPKDIEPKWQKFWEENHTFEVQENSKKEKFYALIEFPYPSGAGLHVGHPRPFTAMDVVSRKRRMQGQNVLFPIGFDAFGLPTENYAIKTGRPPVEVTEENIATFTRQLKSLGFGFDWSRQVDTTDPAYYKWTQWIFLQFFKHGLAYKKNMPINWCPKDKIGLANEEVVDGKCERCGEPVEKRDKEQWMLAITKYADSLLEGLKEVDYIERAKVQQENWIGKSEGAEITFSLQIPGHDKKENLVVFTTRPDTIFGVTFVAISAELAQKGIEQGWNTSTEVKKYIETVLKERVAFEREEQEKTGVDTGIKAINPVSGEEIPVWVTNYVMGGVGTGAIMGVPAHDERDFEFAKKFNLNIKEVVAPYILTSSLPPREDKPTKIQDVVTAIIKNKSTGEYLLQDMSDGRRGFTGGGVEVGETSFEALKREIAEETGYTSPVLISKIIEMLGHGYKQKKDVNCFDPDVVYLVEVDGQPDNELSEEEKSRHTLVWKKQEEVASFINLENHRFAWDWYLKNSACFTGEGVAIHSDFLNNLFTNEATEKIITYLEEKNIGKRKINYKLRDWVFSRQRYWGEPIPLVNCENCGGWVPLPEDQLPLTLPQVEKYEPTDTGESPLAAMTDWVNTTCPKCSGPAKRETDTMPNWAGSSWYFLRYVDPNNETALASKEALKYWMPVDWYNGGMEHTVLHLLYSRFWNQFLFDIGVVPTKEPYKKRTSHGMILAEDGQKMSKSRGNVVNPDEMVEKFGADALRTYIMFMGPFDQAVAWDTNGLIGVRRFLDRAWNLQDKIVGTQNLASNQTNIITTLHQTIKKVTDDIEGMRFNTAIAKMMEFVNEASKAETISKEMYTDFIKLLSPFAPHMTEEIWSTLGNEGSIATASWPVFDENLAKENTVTIAVQVNGKIRATFETAAEISEEEAKSKALSEENVQKYLEGKNPQKIIYVKGKLVSIVV